MKFVVIGTPRENGSSDKTPVEMLKLAKKWIDEMKAKGSIESVYQIIPQGGLAIGNYDSEEALYRDIVQYPLYSSFNWDIKPIMDYTELFDTAIDIVSKRG